MDDNSILNVRSIDYIVLLQHHLHIWYIIIHHHRFAVYSNHAPL